jgi:DNA (cytosine-5)-methyltransferase 1
MSKLKVLELFGGIGACSKALEKLGIDYEIADYVEIDKYAVKSFNAIHNTNFEPQDICAWNKDIEVDLIMHGSPCQDFSLAGRQAGGDEGSGTRSSLMYETIRIVEKLKPKYVIWENVKNVISKKHIHNFNNYITRMSELGYTSYYQVLNAKDYGIPQNRERVFTISILGNENYIFPPKQELKLKLKDMLEDEVDEKYYLSEKMINFFYKNEQVQKEKGNGFRFNVTDGNVIAKTITTRAGSRMDDNFLKIKEATKKGYKEAFEGDGVNISSRMKYQRGNVQKESIQTLTTSGGNDRGVVLNNLRIRKLTPKECFKLMGFDDEDYERAAKVNSNTQLYKQAGNSIVVNVLEAILKELLLNE